jgi:tRNA (cmo5U34)-methyltransferase
MPKDEVAKEGKWVFDADVTKVFEDMLARSIPQYDVMRKLVFDLGVRFVVPETEIVDLGASRGDALAPFVDRFGAYNRYVGVEVSEAMLSVARLRFAGWGDRVRIMDLDLRSKYPNVRASLTLSVLTAMFVPIERRHELIARIYEHTLPRGALVLVEKILGEGAENDALFVDLYYDMKSANDYTAEQIERKRLSLEGVLVPITARWNEEMLRWAGFRRVECFWRSLNFAGWVAVR